MERISASDDNTRVRLKNTIAGISKSDIYLQNGDPIYNEDFGYCPKLKDQLNDYISSTSIEFYYSALLPSLYMGQI